MQEQMTVLEDEELDLKLLKKLRKLENEEYEISEESRNKYAAKIDIKFLSTLLTKYNAKQTLADTQIYALLQVIERRLGISLKIVAPLVFGPNAAKYYSDLIMYGRTLQAVMSPNDALKYLDKDLLLRTSYFMCRGPHEELYDPRFLLRFFLSMVHRMTDLKCAVFAASGALQFVLSSLSLRDAELRSMAYVILQRYLNLLNALSVEDFPEQPLLSYFLRTIKYGVKKPNQRLTSPVSRFLADAIVVILHPTHLMFKPLMASLIQKPNLNLELLPEFRKFFYSTSLANFKTERRWILHVCSMSIHEPSDYGLLEKSGVVGSCLAIFATTIANTEVRMKILAMLNSCLRHESVARDLLITHNLSTWLAVNAYSSINTEEDLRRISLLHERLQTNTSKWLERTPNQLVKSMLRMNGKRIKARSAKSE